MATTIKLNVDDQGSIKLDEFARHVQSAGNKVDQQSKRMRSSFEKVGQGIHTLNARVRSMAVSVPAMLGFGGFLYTGKKVLGMAADQEEIFRRLQTSIEMTGGSWASTKPKVDEFLNSMQAMTRYGDTDLAPVMTDIINLTGDVGRGFEGAKIAADLAATKLFTLDTASKYVAMAMAGNVEMLGRYIPELRASSGLIDKNMSATEKWAVAKELLNKKFGGSAEKDLITYRGMMQSLGNYLGDVAERAGDLIAVQLTPKITEWRNQIKQFIEQGKLEEWAEKAAGGIEKAVDKLTTLGEWIVTHGDDLVNLGKTFLALGAALQVAGIGIKIAEITTAIKALNTAANTGFAAKLFSAGGATAVMGVAAALGFGASMYHALTESAKEYNENVDNMKSKWDGLLGTWVRVNEEGDVTHIWDKVNKKWELNVEVLQDVVVEADKVTNAINRAGSAAANAGGKLADVPDLATGRDKKQSLIKESGDARVNIRGANQDLVGMQTAVDQVGIKLGKVNVFWESFGSQVKDVGASIYQNITSNIADAIVEGENLGDVFKDIGKQMLKMAIQFAMTAAMNSIFPGAGMFGGLFHSGGPVTRMHSGGLRPDERVIIAQAGEYMTQKSSVNRDTLPTLAYINKTGKAPATNVNISGDQITINGGSMDSGTVQQIKQTVARSREALAREIEYLVQTRRLSLV